jgi:hypothetical protein
MANPRPHERQAEQQRHESAGTQAGSASENIRSISEASSEAAGSAVDMSQRAAQTGFEMLERNKETAQQLLEHSTELFTHLARQSSEQMGRMLGFSGDNEEGARRTTRSFQALVQSGDVIASASRDLSREWFSTMRGVLDAGSGRSETLAGCRTPHDFLAMQLETMQAAIQATLHGTKKLAEISAQAATQATQKMSDAAKRAA